MSLNILIVDDSKVARSMMIKVLKLVGLPLGEIHQAENGKHGLEQLEENWIDLVFADINMPIMNGEEMISQIRDNPTLKDLPIIVVSTEGSETRVGRIKELGTEFIHKPFSPEVAREIIMKVIGITEMDDSNVQEQSF